MIYFIEFINKVGPIARELYSLRSILSSQSDLHYYEIFKRIDTSMKGYISKSDLVQTLGLSQNFSKLAIKQLSKSQGMLKLLDFKQIIQSQQIVNKALNKLTIQEVLFIVRSIMEMECEYILESQDVVKELNKLDVKTVLELFQKFDIKKLHYIESNDIKMFLHKVNSDISKYLDLVLKKQFKYELIGFEQFYDFFQKSLSNSLIADLPNIQEKVIKKVHFNDYPMLTPTKYRTISKHKPRSSSKKSRNTTPIKYRTMSPKCWKQSTIIHEQNTQKLLSLFHPGDPNSVKKTYNRYFKVYSIYK